MVDVMDRVRSALLSVAVEVKDLGGIHKEKLMTIRWAPAPRHEAGCDAGAQVHRIIQGKPHRLFVCRELLKQDYFAGAANEAGNNSRTVCKIRSSVSGASRWGRS